MVVGWVCDFDVRGLFGKSGGYLSKTGIVFGGSEGEMDVKRRRSV